MKNYCKVRHNMKGRIRVSIKEACYEEAPLSFIQAKCLKLDAIDSIRINPRCNVLAIYYKNTNISFQVIIEKVNTYMHEYLTQMYGQPESLAIGASIPNFTDVLTKKKHCPECTQKELQKRSHKSGTLKNKDNEESLVRPALFRFASLSAVMGVVFVRRVLFGATVAQTALSPLGIIAMAFSVPLIKDAYKQLKKKKVTLEGFLGFGAISATIVGEALTAFEILWINSGAELLTAWVTERSRKSISAILDMTSHHTFILQDGVEIEKKVSDLQVGDIVVLHTGEKVCIDGEVIEGEALLDESPISGRADFVPKSKGESVLAGTFVRQGLIYIRAEKVGDQTYLARILCLVEDSLTNKAPIETLADKLAKNIMILGFVATGATYLLTASLWRAFTVMLVMACPCATVLAASTAVNASINTAARRHILIKGGRYIEELGKVNCVCFDKTGTLTTSEPRLIGITLLQNHDIYVKAAEHIASDEEHEHQDLQVQIGKSKTQRISIYDAESALLQLVVSTEMHNHHPLAQAIKQEATRRNIEPIAHTSCEYTLGMGMKAIIHEHKILVGNQKLMEAEGLSINPKDKNLNDSLVYLQKRGYTVLFVAQDSQIVALLSFDNPMRPEAKRVVSSLVKNGIQNTCIITGDEPNTAQNLAKELGINHFYASVMPEQKADIIKELQAKYGSVLMVGDGINDAMALTEADIGIAMGSGASEVAVEAADITLVTDDLSSIVYVHSLSKQTVRVVHQNFWIATGSNLVGLVLGATGIMSPVMAGMLHIVHTLGVVANSSRLLAYGPRPLLIEKHELDLFDFEAQCTEEQNTNKTLAIDTFVSEC